MPDERVSEDNMAVRAKHASQFGVPDGGRYANDWASRIDAVLAALATCEAERDEARADAERLAEAIAWALGESGDFPTRQEGEGAYWWRTELRRRAARAQHEEGE